MLPLKLGTLLEYDWVSNRRLTMSRKPRVQRTLEDKEVMLEGLKSGNIAETC